MKNCNCLADQSAQTALNTGSLNYSPMPIGANIYDLSEKTKKKPVKKWVNQPITKQDIQEAQDVYDQGKGVGTIKIGNPQMVVNTIPSNQALSLPGQPAIQTNSNGMSDIVEDAKRYIFSSYGLFVAAGALAIYLYMKK